MSKKACIWNCEDGWIGPPEGYVDRELAAAHVEEDEARARSLRASLERTVRPCPACRPEAYERWSEGHYGPNHWCEDCEELRRPRRKAAKA